MQDELKPIEDTEFDDAFALIPEEVQDFMWSDEFKFLLDTAQKALSLTDTEKQSMRTACYRILLNLRSMEQEAKRVLAEGVDPEKAVKMFYIIDTEILERARNILAQVDIDEEGVDSMVTTQTSAPSPSDILARLNQTMTAPSTLAPTKRVYTTETTAPTPPPNSPAPTGIKSIDPYREMPDR
ncbi:MAG: hypothetical protein KBB91_01725 [Candidatus Pacebacteria bacterium]|jgi:hypothetical protein|nr:hypothetical protein [Candidatus Paceibacterota bacterium]MBP9701161.1 hypothetical protein [Candidatus Paceibacterota bacterium]